MDSEHLAQEVAIIITLATDRITGVGKEQYEITLGGEKVQSFESADIIEVCNGVLEEIEDSINHLAMLHIRVRRLSEEANRIAQGE